jgi:hypothetical protein
MPERHAKSIKVLIRQFGENVDIDIALSEALRVLGHAEHFEPVRNLLHRGPRRDRAQLSFWTSATGNFPGSLCRRIKQAKLSARRGRPVAVGPSPPAQKGGSLFRRAADPVVAVPLVSRCTIASTRQDIEVPMCIN